MQKNTCIAPVRDSHIKFARRLTTSSEKNTNSKSVKYAVYKKITVTIIHTSVKKDLQFAESYPSIQLI